MKAGAAVSVSGQMVHGHPLGFGATVVKDHDDVSMTLPAASRAPDTDAVYDVAWVIGVVGVNVAVFVAAS